MRTHTLLFLVLGGVALAGSFVYFQPERPASPPAKSHLQETHTAEIQTSGAGADIGPAEHYIQLDLAGPHPSASPPVLSLQQGRSVVITFSSNRDGELHLHGYDQTIILSSSSPVELKLDTIHSGRFEYELHGSNHAGHRSLGVIEIHPQ